MAYDYKSEVKNAEADLKDAGQQVTLRKKTNTFNASTGANTRSLADTKFYILAMSIKEAEKEFKGAQLEDGDMPVYMSANSTVVPVKGDQIITRAPQGLQVWNIEYVEMIAPGPVTVLYMIQLRK